MKDFTLNLYKIWTKLYGQCELDKLDNFIDELLQYKSINKYNKEDKWYKKSVVYSLYVQNFNNTFEGIIDKLDHLKELGIDCLWLLPVLDSPMQDDGFDVRNYGKLRDDICNNGIEGFEEFISVMHKNEMKIIFDLPINHCSTENEWFKKACTDKASKYRNYFIWSNNINLYEEAPVLFKELSESNWTKLGDEYYFHRFLSSQPDFNYRNPEVLLEMTKIIVYWLQRGVDGFRLDAAPFIWKEEGTSCENLPGTHLIIEFFRTVAQQLDENILFLAEACQPTEEIKQYIYNNKECNAAYNFPLITAVYKSLATESPEAILSVLQKLQTFELDAAAQWFMFLRSHDELSFESAYINEEDRNILFKHYCKDKRCSFRQDEGIAARLSALMDNDINKIMLAFSILLTLPTTPIIYYGDEMAATNDFTLYELNKNEKKQFDSRKIVRTKIDWEQWNKALQNKNSLSYKVFYKLKNLIQKRNDLELFKFNDIEIIITDIEVLAYKRKYKEQTITILHNLSGNEQMVDIAELGIIILEPYEYKWIQ